MRIDDKKLQIAMARKCWTFDNLALATGISRAALHYQRRAKRVQPATVGKIAKALGVDVIEIVT